MISLVDRNERTELRRHAPPVEQVLATVAKFWNLDAADLRGPSRRMHITLPRQVMMWLLYQRCGYSFEAAASALDRDHTTAVHACRAIARTLKVDERLAEQIEHLERQLGIAHLKEKRHTLIARTQNPRHTGGTQP